jgi:putative ABC transport system permease protein
VDPETVLSTGPGRRTSIFVEAVEAGAYTTVLAGSAVTPDLPAAFANPPTSSGTGTVDQPIPAVVSTRWPNGQEPLSPGASFELTISGQTLTYRVEAFVATFPGVARTEPFVIVPYESVAAARQGSPLVPTALFVRAPQDVVADLRAAQPSGHGSPRVESRYERYAVMHDAPLVAAVAGGFTVALVLAAAYAALAVIAVVILHAQRRSRELAFLRTLGMTDRQAASLTLVEQGLPVVLALAIGIVLGLGLAWLLAPGIDLAAFSSPDTTVRLQVNWASVVGVGVSVCAVVAVAIASSSWLARRLDLGQALRIGEE